MKTEIVGVHKASYGRFINETNNLRMLPCCLEDKFPVKTTEVVSKTVKERRCCCNRSERETTTKKNGHWFDGLLFVGNGPAQQLKAFVIRIWFEKLEIQLD